MVFNVDRGYLLAKIYVLLMMMSIVVETVIKKHIVKYLIHVFLFDIDRSILIFSYFYCLFGNNVYFIKETILWIQ
jgi:hypothetical protein